MTVKKLLFFVLLLVTFSVLVYGLIFTLLKPKKTDAVKVKIIYVKVEVTPVPTLTIRQKYNLSLTPVQKSTPSANLKK